MTLHSAKGLEADNIVIAGVADQLIPGYSTGEDYEEQRRLLYVAITRAKNELVISWPQSVLRADAQSERIRIDSNTTITLNSEVIVKLGQSKLLPPSLGNTESGATWLGNQN